MHKKDLWLRLKAYHFDHIVAPGLWEHVSARFGKTNPSVKAFARKIAKKHGWKNNFAARALEEYKKFVYLGLLKKFQVTPSKVIDVVWHEHLLFSKAYRDFCNEVIEQQFDHHPELLPVADQTGRFSAQYVATVELYKTEFGLEPPPDIWGDTKFDKEQLGKKSSASDTMTYAGDDSDPLHTYFEGGDASSYPEFSGFDGGEAGGAGASGDWGDSGGSDGGDSGDGGGCSGGCSGGCGGGGD